MADTICTKQRVFSLSKARTLAIDISYIALLTTQLLHPRQMSRPIVRTAWVFPNRTERTTAPDPFLVFHYTAKDGPISVAYGRNDSEGFYLKVYDERLRRLSAYGVTASPAVARFYGWGCYLYLYTKGHHTHERGIAVDLATICYYWRLYGAYEEHIRFMTARPRE